MEKLFCIPKNTEVIVYSSSFALICAKMNYQIRAYGVTHIGVGNLPFNDEDRGLSPGRRQSIIWTNSGILLIGPLGPNFSEILIEISTILSKKMSLKMPSGK